MEDERADNDAALQRQIDEMRQRLTVNRADIDSLVVQADGANHRVRDVEPRADAAERRADASEELSAEDRCRLGDLEEHVDLDRALILELQTDGLISQQQAAHLQVALHSSRRIGAALGIVMANRKVTEADAFRILIKASQNTNRKFRVIADELVETGDLSNLPAL